MLAQAVRIFNAISRAWFRATGTAAASTNTQAAEEPVVIHQVKDSDGRGRQHSTPPSSPTSRVARPPGAGQRRGHDAICFCHGSCWSDFRGHFRNLSRCTDYPSYAGRHSRPRQCNASALGSPVLARAALGPSALPDSVAVVCGASHRQIFVVDTSRNVVDCAALICSVRALLVSGRQWPRLPCPTPAGSGPRWRAAASLAPRHPEH